MKTRSTGVLLAAALSACGGGGGSSSSPSQTSSAQNLAPTVSLSPDYQLVWRDEFDQDGLPDASKWDYDTYRNASLWHNSELQYYSAGRLQNSQVTQGKLVITAREESLSSLSDWNGQRYSSTRLVTRGKAQWTYGHFEIRAKLPCGLGTWPAIWMLGAHTLPAEPNWPTDGEIDIVEQRGFTASEKQKVLGTLHFADAYGGGGPTAEKSLPSACSEFNVYHMTWMPDHISIGVNGVNYNTYTKPVNATHESWPFDSPQYLLLNVAVGGILGLGLFQGDHTPLPESDIQLPSSMEVDYVRVWQSTR